jgi:hypothetical protein
MAYARGVLRRQRGGARRRSNGNLVEARVSHHLCRPRARIMLMARLYSLKCHSLGLQVQSDVARKCFPTRSGGPKNILKPRETCLRYQFLDKITVECHIMQAGATLASLGRHPGCRVARSTLAHKGDSGFISNSRGRLRWFLFFTLLETCNKKQTALFPQLSCG